MIMGESANREAQMDHARSSQALPPSSDEALQDWEEAHMWWTKDEAREGVEW